MVILKQMNLYWDIIRLMKNFMIWQKVSNQNHPMNYQKKKLPNGIKIMQTIILHKLFVILR